MIGYAVGIGTLAGWATFAAAAAAAVAFWRGGGNTAISSLEIANRVLEKRVKDLEDQSKLDTSTIAELRGRTDVSLAMRPLVEWSVRHEERAQKRSDQMLLVLEMIASRLGQDTNGHTT